MRPLITIVLSDLRQRVRDRSMLVFGLAVPLAIIALFSVLFSGLEDGPDLEPITVAVSSPADDEMADQLLGVLDEMDLMEVTLTEAEPDRVEEMAQDREVPVGVVVPQDFTAAITSGRATEVRVILGDEDGLEAGIVVAVIDGVIEQMAAGSLTATAAAMGGAPPDQLQAIGRQVGESAQRVALIEGEAADEQLSLQATLVAGQAGMFLLFTVGFGVLALIFEREQGTLTRLESFPLRPGTIVAAKAASGFVLGLITTTILLTAGSLVFDTSFGDLLPVTVLVLCAVTAATSLIFIVARVARTSEQATVAQAALAMVLGIAGGAFFPFRTSGWVGTLLELNPVAALVRGLGITSGGGGLEELGVPLASLVGFAVVAAVVARVIPDRTMHR